MFSAAAKAAPSFSLHAGIRRNSQRVWNPLKPQCLLLLFLFLFCLLDESSWAACKEQRGGPLTKSPNFAAALTTHPIRASPASSMLLLRKGMPVQQRDGFGLKLSSELLQEEEEEDSSFPDASVLLEAESQVSLHPIDRSFILSMCLGFVMCMLVLLLFVTLISATFFAMPQAPL
ncbi:hypothetical protein Emed_004064 [Eimeria media]